MSRLISVLEAIEAGDGARLRALVTEDPRLACARDESGISVLMIALYHRKPDLVGILLAAGPDLDLYEAAALGRAARVAAILDDNPHMTDRHSPDGFTPLHLASFSGSGETVRTLLDRGADARARSRNPMNLEPLHSAAALGHYEAAELLLARGADPNARQAGGWTPLQSRALHGDERMTRLLLAHGGDPDQPADDGRTARQLARDDRIRSLFDAARRR